MTTECGQVQNYQEKTAHTKVRNEPSWTNRPSCRSPFHRMRRPVRPILPLPVGPSAEQGTKCCPTLRSVSFVVHRALRHSTGWDRSVQPIPTPLPVGPSAGAGGNDLVFNMKRKGQLSSLVFGLRFNVKKERPGHPGGSRWVVACHGPFFQLRAGRCAKRQHRDNIRPLPRYIA
jgi:hypothetical protein